MVEGETEALLLEPEIDSQRFSKEVEDCLSKDDPWTTPEVQ